MKTIVRWRWSVNWHKSGLCTTTKRVERVCFKGISQARRRSKLVSGHCSNSFSTTFTLLPHFLCVHNWRRFVQKSLSGQIFSYYLIFLDSYVSLIFESVDNAVPYLTIHSDYLRQCCCEVCATALQKKPCLTWRPYEDVFFYGLKWPVLQKHRFFCCTYWSKCLKNCQIVRQLVKKHVKSCRTRFPLTIFCVTQSKKIRAG